MGQGSIDSILFCSRDYDTVEFWAQTYEMCQRFFSPISGQVVDPKFRPVYHFGASELDQYVGSNLEMSKCQFYQQYAVVTDLISI